MALLTIPSYSQMAGQMFASFESNSGITDANTAALSLQIIEAAAENDFIISSDILSVLDSIDITRSFGSNLDLLASGEGLARFTASASSGGVSITDGTFAKVATQIYQGLPAPIPGTTLIYVTNASGFPSAGKIYIGRGTNNIEGPIPYSSVSQVGSYWSITLSSATVKFHNQNETIILAQGGNRVIPSGSTVNTGTIGASTQIGFSTTNAVTIPDGETTITGVPVICSQTGNIGNIPINAITQFASPPFPNLTVVNSLPFTNAIDQESDTELRDRIKLVRSARANATPQAILNAVIGIVATDEQKRVLSANIVDGNTLSPTILYVDDGTGYEPIFTGIATETIITSALGGEQYLSLQNQGVVKAQISTLNSEPYALADGVALAMDVGGVLTQHTFSASSFEDITNATAYEVVASINADPNLLWSARTTGGGTKVVLFADAYSNEDIQIEPATSAVDANNELNFQTNHVYSLKLYKNDQILNKDGLSASVSSIAFPWNLPASSYTLQLAVDNTPTATYTFTSTDVLPYTPITAPLQTWVNAFNNKIPGITASVFGEQAVITSNKGASNSASIQIVGGTLVTSAGVFAVQTATGVASDYSLIKGSGQIKLTVPAVAGDSFKAGDSNTQAYVQTAAQSSGSINVSTTGNLYVVADSSVSSVITGALTGVVISVSNVSTNIWRYTGPANCFSNVTVGNWVIIWDSGINSGNQGYFRVCNTDKNTYIDVENINGATTGSPYTLANNNGLLVYSSLGLVQKYTAGVNNYSLAQWVTDLNNNKLLGVEASVANTNYIRLTTNSFKTSGAMALLSADTGALPFDFKVGSVDTNNPSQNGFAESGNSDLGNTDFLAYLIGNANNSATNPYVFAAASSVTVSPDHNLAWVKSYNVSSTVLRYGNNRYNWDSLRNIVNGSVTINLVNKPGIKERLTNERAYVAKSFDFASSDNLLMVFDDNPDINTLTIPLYRTVSVTSSPSPTTNSFSAIDVDGGNVSLASSFGSAYDFSNYRAWSRSRAVVDAGNANDGFIIYSSSYGPIGDNYRFFMEYPTASSLTFSNSINSGNTVGGVDLILNLSSGAARTPNWDGTTAMSVSVSGNNAQYNYVSGTSPNFVSASVTVGDIVTIASGTSFSASNQGTFLVTGVANTSFSVTNYNPGVNNSSQTLNATGNLLFYPINATATNLVAYVNSAMSINASAKLAVGSSGAGLVNKRILDFSGSTLDYVSLADGENWINTSSLTSSPQFTTESNFSVTSTLYSLSGETFKFIPHRTDQCIAFMGSQAVSGVNNLGSLLASSDGSKVQIATNTLGTAGAVKIDGGTANAVGGSIIGANVGVGSPVAYDLIRTTFGSAVGLNANSWLELTSATPLQKNLKLDTTTVMSITTPNTIGIVSGDGVFQTVRTYSGDNTTQMMVDKQGKFASYTWTGTGTNPNFANLVQGDFVIVNSTSNFSAVNQGIFRIIRANSSQFWVENNSAIEEQQTLNGVTDFNFYDVNSIIPGDSLVISGNTMGASNNGVYVVSQVTSVTTLTVATNFSVSSINTPLTNNGFNNINSFDQKIYNFYRSIKTIAPSSSISGLTDIVLKDYVSQLVGKFSQSAGFTFEVLNKLAFPVTNNFGTDGYAYYNGLIGAANEVVYGSPLDPISYPGVKAAGALLEIQSPLPQLIEISLGVRLKTGISFSALKTTITSTVAGIINSAGIGQSISLSDISSAVAAIDGITSVVILYPTGSDIISVSANSKPLVLNQNNITVSLLS